MPNKEEKSIVEKVAESQSQKPLKEQLKDLNYQMATMSTFLKKDKSRMTKVKFPFKVKAAMRKAWKKNKITVLYLRNDNIIDCKIGERVDGNVIVNGIHHDGGKEYVWLWRGKKPIMIIPEWDIQPVGTKQYQDAMTEGRSTYPERIILRAMKMIEVGTGKKMNPMTIVWIVLACIIGGYLLFSGIGGG